MRKRRERVAERFKKKVVLRKGRNWRGGVSVENWLKQEIGKDFKVEFVRERTIW